MAQLSIVGISGSVTRPSRTTALVRTVLAAIEERTGADIRLLELVDVAPHLFSALTPDKLGEEGRAIIRLVESADLLVVGSPVYRASYTGAVKHLFDLIRYDALSGKPVVLTATGGSLLHGLVTEHQLRPLFGFLNALTLPTAVYATEADFQDYRIVSPVVVDRIGRVADEAASLIDAGPHLAFGPAARAARLPAALSA